MKPIPKKSLIPAISFSFPDFKSGLWIFSFILPVGVLLGWALLNEYHLRSSRTVTLPVEGYDPRDLLSGYYLMYTVQYGVKCPESPKRCRGMRCGLSRSGKSKAYICFAPEKYITLWQKPKNCSLFIQGQCVNKEFTANINRYYLPEKKAKKGTAMFRKAQKKQVVLAVTSKGHALVKDILVEGESLKKQLQYSL